MWSTGNPLCGDFSRITFFLDLPVFPPGSRNRQGLDWLRDGEDRAGTGCLVRRGDEWVWVVGCAYALRFKARELLSCCATGDGVDIVKARWWSECVYIFSGENVGLDLISSLTTFTSSFTLAQQSHLLQFFTRQSSRSLQHQHTFPTSTTFRKQNKKPAYQNEVHFLPRLLPPRHQQPRRSSSRTPHSRIRKERAHQPLLFQMCCCH